MELKIYRILDCDSVIAESEEEAIKWYCNEFDPALEDEIREWGVGEVNEDGYFFMPTDYDQEKLGRIYKEEVAMADWEGEKCFKKKFKWEIQDCIKEKRKTPYLVCSTEY